MIDYIIVGQGIAGTVLHRKLTQDGKRVIILDDGYKTSSSVAAAGLINPITGRKYVKSWRIEEFLPVAQQTYEDLSQLLDTKVYDEVTIHRALYAVKDENTWYARMEDPLASQFILPNADTSVYRDTIKNVLGYGSLKGMQVKLSHLLNSYKEYLQANNQFIETVFEVAKLEISASSVNYDGVEARGIIFAEGFRSMNNPLWSYLPFQPVKGEVLLVRIEGNPFKDVLRHKIFITPVENDLYWIGAGYEWDFEDDAPTSDGKQRLIEQLDSILSVPYTIVKHIAGIRPAVKGRKPFLGKHPTYNNVYLFNGMGTKGTSLAPFWAEHFTQYLNEQIELDKDVNIEKHLE